jgi:pheromone shutdown protein TraB
VITLVGVGHVFDLQSGIRRAIEDRRPAIVGVELDPARFQALQAPETRRPSFGVYAILAYVQRRIASEYGTQAGAEMVAAAHAAKEVGARLAFLDLDSRSVLSRLMRAMSAKEKVKFALSVLGGLFVRKSTVERELQRFEANEGAFIDDLARDFPSVKRVLIDERNAHMAQALRSLEADHGTVLAVVGEGHVEGLRALLADRSPEVVRLRDLRSPPPAAGNASVSLSFGP